MLKQLIMKLPFVSSLHKSLYRPLKLSGSPGYRYVSLYPPGHFYSPLPDFNQLQESHQARQRGSTLHELPGVDLNTDTQLSLVRNFAAYQAEQPFTDHPAEARRYFYDNSYFSYGDGVVLYSFLRHFKPAKVIEVGSGFSSAAMLDVNDLFCGKKINFTFIEPYPDRLRTLFRPGDQERNRVIEEPVQDVPLELFAELAENDILFIDSSHVVKVGSDVLHLLSAVLPVLRPGVLIHFHDILWPLDYPWEWLAEGRAWNEAYFLRAFLQYNNAFEVICFNSYLAALFAGAMTESLPLALKQPSAPLTRATSSLWLRKIR